MMSPPHRLRPSLSWRECGTFALAIAVATGLITGLAILRLQPFPYPLDVKAALAGAAVTSAQTVPAALRSWLLVGVAIGALARWIRRHARDWSVGEAAAGALVLCWGGAYVSLLALGPLGLYRASMLRPLLATLVLLALVAGGRLAPAAGPAAPTRRAGRWRAGIRDAGPWLLALAFTLAAGPLLLLQIASPVSPFMDVLGYIAPVQKIVTFEFYDPYANDAAGLWAPTRQVVGFDAGLSFVALVAGLPAHLAISSLILPFAWLQLAALSLLARVTSGRLAGGMTALFLLQTFLWRRTPDVRSTGLAFPLVAIGLALLLHTRRDGRRAALGGLALGLAVTVSPLIGAIGMQVGAAAAVVEWLDRGRGLRTPLLALAGGSLFALPQVAVGLAVSAPAFALPAAAATGLAFLAGLSRGTHDRARASGRRRPLALGAVALLPAAVLFLHARRQSEFFNDAWFGYPVLLGLAFAGLAVTLRALWRREGTLAAAVPALALWVGLLNYAIAAPHRFSGPLEVRSLAGEVTSKMIYYWWPAWLALGAGTWFSMLARRWSLVGAAALALVLVVYPLHHVQEPLDYDGQQLSLAETWGFHLTNAANGYHSGRTDRRWVLDAAWREVAASLMRERAAGRIGYRTHVLVISPSIDSVELALWTGISVDLITPQYDPQSPWTGNGRARGMDALPAALAARPRYVLVQGFPGRQFAGLASYDQLLARPLLQLYRAREAGPEAVPPAAVSDATM